MKSSPSPTVTPLIARLNALDGWSSREVWDATVKEAATALQSSESDLERARALLKEALQRLRNLSQDNLAERIAKFLGEK